MVGTVASAPVRCVMCCIVPHDGASLVVRVEGEVTQARCGPTAERARETNAEPREVRRKSASQTRGFKHTRNEQAKRTAGPNAKRPNTHSRTTRHARTRTSRFASPAGSGTSRPRASGARAPTTNAKRLRSKDPGSPTVQSTVIQQYERAANVRSIPC